MHFDLVATALGSGAAKSRGTTLTLHTNWVRVAYTYTYTYTFGARPRRGYADAAACTTRSLYGYTGAVFAGLKSAEGRKL